ncbi:m7GpppX diphosphatase [Topomyia yanbarensis]|uniref:m7GpppX diphosphatase n=1 Tax=Topomyia yanbarensis TaxID=2498891 RepID=UPI00273C9DF4|nr:m7GpppX diphosphatase [Topomyia yanbarensis]
MLKTVSAESNNSSKKQNYDDSQLRQGQQETAAPTATSPSSAPDSSSIVGDGSSNSTAISYKLADFELVRILNNNSTHKSVTVLGHFANISREDYAIIVLEKTAFTEKQLINSQQSQSKAVTTSNSHTETLQPSSESEQNSTSAVERSFFSATSQLRTEFINDIYGNFLCVVDPEVNQIKVTIVYPASEKHIAKYSAQTKYLVEETALDYQTVTLPHLKQEQLSLEWLYNILEHRKEKERIVFEDLADETGFILLPDLKWDGKTVEQLYLLALVHQRGIKSLRDLNGSHLPLLKNIRDRGIDAIKKRYGIDADQLRIYIHYQPTFYHFHVHFTYLRHDSPGTNCEKSHLLSTVIGNIELLSDYYQKITLPFIVNGTDKLYEKLKASKNPSFEPEAKRSRVE